MTYRYAFDDETGAITRSLHGTVQYMSYARFSGFTLCAWDWSDREQDAVRVSDERSCGTLRTLRLYSR